MSRIQNCIPVYLGLVITILVFAVSSANAQVGMLERTTIDESSTSVVAPPLPEPLTRQAIREVLSGLNDAQARALLLNELDNKVALREQELANAHENSLGAVLSGLAHALGKSWEKTLSQTPDLLPAMRNTFGNFVSQRVNTNLWRIPGVLLASLLVGFLATVLVRRLTNEQRSSLKKSFPSGLWSQMKVLSARFAFQGMQLLAFVIAASVANSLLNHAAPVDRIFVSYVIEALGTTIFAVIVARLVMSPARPDIRLCTLDDNSASFLTWRTGVIFGWAAFFGHVPGLIEFGWPVELRLGVWLILGFYGLIILTFWQARKAITEMVIGRGETGPTWQRFANIWPVIAIGLIVMQWLIVELFIATGNKGDLSLTAMNLTTATLMALPLLELLIPALVAAIWPENPEHPPELQAAHKLTMAGLMRFVRLIFMTLVVFWIAKLWGVDLQSLASKGVGAQVAGAMMEIFLISIVAYGLWELLNIFADRQVAIERVTLGIDSEGDGHSDGEGGQGGTRLGTLMPLIRGSGQVVIAVMSVLAILGQLGVNVTPLLAGAGIFGLAIGFGAQTLVKDIFSGVFFLIDDAFRKGEYVNVGSVKGVVEKISIRSLQLRHHKGALNTIPFGEIRHLTNYSRDWVIMKLPLRLTYDTDGNKVRKMIKKLGQKLLENPEIGHLFLSPLKSQGVLAMEDSAMISRVKFATKPGDQWIVRRYVLDEIHKLFKANNIHFASREVTVRIAQNDGDEPLTESDKKLATAAAQRIIEP